VRDDGGVQHGVPAGLLEQAGLVALERLPARQGGMWLVDWNGTLGVLRRLDPPPGWAADADLAADAGWVHGFLDWLVMISRRPGRCLCSVSGPGL
jgi:hypothetical protein